MGCFEHLGVVVAKMFQIIGAGMIRVSWAFHGSFRAETGRDARGNTHGRSDSLFCLSEFSRPDNSTD